jgi:hypothetical protein
MVPAQTDDSGMLPPIIFCVCCGVIQNLSVSLFHLLKGVCGIEGGNWDIATVYYRQPFLEGIDAPYWVVAPAFLFAGGAGADSSGSEAGAGAVGGGCVIGEA